MSQLEKLEYYINLIKEAKDIKQLNELRINLLGKKGTLTDKIKALANESIEERKKQGSELNGLKKAIEEQIALKQNELENNHEKDSYDYTLALDKANLNEVINYNITVTQAHIINSTIERFHQIFKASGFEHIIGPDIEDSYYNFEALNIPFEHPARDNNDTFYIKGKETLLRTHTTCVQIRLLESIQNSPCDIRSYSIGRVYRNDAHDATHASSFHQIEGIIIEDNITMQHLKGFLEYLFEEFFEKKTNVLFSPSYYPFTEPSCQIDIFAKKENGQLIVTKENEGEPLEIGGCGIVHPSILEKFNQKGKQAFAFGIGLERLCMIKHGISNLHDLYSNYIPTLQYISQKS